MERVRTLPPEAREAAKRARDQLLVVWNNITGVHCAKARSLDRIIERLEQWGGLPKS